MILDLHSNLFSKKNQGIGIEIAADKINIAQLVKKGNKYKIDKYISKESPEGVFQQGKITDSFSLAELIEEMLKEAKIKAKKVEKKDDDFDDDLIDDDLKHGKSPN